MSRDVQLEPLQIIEWLEQHHPDWLETAVWGARCGVLEAELAAVRAGSSAS